ncbi:RNA polymerase II mediator complex subunit [Ascosphaera aggregata]|nr:RNA polymerase II mediator complex subunit [Ascosphaera aggregata]
MADVLTQLQACLDQLATQFYASLCYITTYHDHSPAIVPDVPSYAPRQTKIPKNPPPGVTQVPQPLQLPPDEQAAQDRDKAERKAKIKNAIEQGQPIPSEALPTGPQPDPPHLFQRRMRELARDLILKEQQFEYLVGMLPGAERSEDEQVRRIKELGEELRGVEWERTRKREELRVLREKVEGLLGAVDRGLAP